MRRARWFGYWLGCAFAVVLALWLPNAAFAAEVAIGNAGSYPLSREFSFLEDPDGKLSFEEVQQEDKQGRFAALPSDSPGPNFGITSSVIWLKVTLRPTADAPVSWLLEVAYAPLGRLEFYAPGPDGYVRQRLVALKVKQKGRHLKPSEVRRWRRDYFHQGFGLVRLGGTIQYPEAA